MLLLNGLPVKGQRNAADHQNTLIFPLKLLIRMSPIGVVGCVVAGLMLGTIDGLLPVYAVGIGLEQKYSMFSHDLLLHRRGIRVFIDNF